MTHHDFLCRRTHASDGTALFAVIVATVMFVGLTGAMISVSTSSTREQEAESQWQQRRYLAETGLADAIVELSAWQTGNIGTVDSPREFGAGSYRVTATENANGTITMRSFGMIGGSERVLEAVVRDELAGPFTHSIFAANSSQDPTYVLDFGGTGGQADLLTGDMYSGGDLAMSGDATATGNLRAAGTVYGASGESGVTIPMPDIAGANYPLNNDVDVAQEFALHGVSTGADNGYGGTADHVPETSLAHIFRKNPSDRTGHTLATVKDDYFLEDVYENTRADNTTNPASATHITLAGVGDEPGVVSGNQKVYYVDGNVWIHNRRVYSFSLWHDVPGGVQITIVARGNVYFADNMLIRDHETDGIAFVAIKDPAVADSGNIYFGDPSFGTLMQMDAYMYAEDDFYDSNLSAVSSSEITVNGTMSAGDQIAINRDTGSNHTRLVMNFDDRLDRGVINMPGVPRITTSGRRAIEVLSVYEVGSR